MSCSDRIVTAYDEHEDVTGVRVMRQGMDVLHCTIMMLWVCRAVISHHRDDDGDGNDGVTTNKPLSNDTSSDMDSGIDQVLFQ